MIEPKDSIERNASSFGWSLDVSTSLIFTRREQMEPSVGEYHIFRPARSNTLQFGRHLPGYREEPAAAGGNRLPTNCATYRRRVPVPQAIQL